MAATQFGLGQINKPTPSFVMTIFNVIFYGAAIINLGMAVFTDIPEHSQLLILKYSGEAVLFARGMAHLFGVTITEPTVPTKDVAVVKNEGK